MYILRLNLNLLRTLPVDEGLNIRSEFLKNYNETVGTTIFIWCPFGEQLNIIGLLVGPLESDSGPISVYGVYLRLLFAWNFASQSVIIMESYTGLL
jgi:hypothetical protein